MATTILILGKDGQLARALADAQPEGLNFIFKGRDEINLLDQASVLTAIALYKPAVVVNTAAYTAVDLAETQREQAYALNGQAVEYIAYATHKAGIPFIHISTDFVFDGKLGRPYVEADAVNPINIYGASKLEGEYLALAANPESIILRTAWLTGGHTKNFLPAILGRAVSKPEEPFTVNADQFGSPTLVQDLAVGIVQMLETLVHKGMPAGGAGVFHMAGVEHASRFSFAQAILGEARAAGAQVAEITEGITQANSTPATRPMDTRLDCSKLKQVWGVEVPSYRARLGEVVRGKLG